MFFSSENVISRNDLISCQVQKPLKLDILRFDFYPRIQHLYLSLSFFVLAG